MSQNVSGAWRSHWSTMEHSALTSRLRTLVSSSNVMSWAMHLQPSSLAALWWHCLSLGIFFEKIWNKLKKTKKNANHAIKRHFYQKSMFQNICRKKAFAEISPRPEVPRPTLQRQFLERLEQKLNEEDQVIHGVAGNAEDPAIRAWNVNATKIN